MNDDQFNPHDPLYLVSRSFDEDLTSEERRRLDEILAESPELWASAEELRRANSLVRRWSAPPPSIDAELLTHSVLGRIRSAEASPHEARLTDLLHRWAAVSTEAPLGGFTADVMSAVRRDKRHRMATRLMFRIGAPLAAAAVVALAVTITWLRAPKNESGVEVTTLASARPEIVRFRPDPAVDDRVTISFSRTTLEPRQPSSEPGVGFIWIGSSAAIAEVTESPPL